MSASTSINPAADPSSSKGDALDRLAARRAADTLVGIGEVLYGWDIRNGQIDWSEGAAELLGLDDASGLATARRFAGLLDPASRTTRETVIADAPTRREGDTTRYRIEYALDPKHLATDEPLWVEDCGFHVAGADGRPATARGALRVVTERRKAEERASRAAFLDAATRIPNRAALDLAVEQALEGVALPRPAAAREVPGARPRPEVFVLVAIEGVETVNSVYGFAAGDALILEASRRLRSAMRGEDMIGRFSGAKFGLVLHECRPEDAEIAARRFLHALEDGNIDTPTGPIAPDALIAAVCLTDAPRDMGGRDGDRPQPRAVYTAAYQTLEKARQNLRESIALYHDDPERQASYQEAANVASTVNRALKTGRVRLAWQPVVDAGTHATVFHEALIRMETEDGVWEAGRFIETAVKLNMVRRVDHYALDAATDVLQAHDDAVLSLNLSNDTAADPLWLKKLSRLLEPRPDLAERLIVEITESHAAHSLRHSRQFIHALHDLGARVALDDFGAGFTAFRNLKDLDFDIIKIDGRFAADLVASRENQEFIRSLVRLAKLFDAKTVVEWVEDSDAAETLYEWGVDYLQGFYFGKASTTLPWTP